MIIKDKEYIYKIDGKTYHCAMDVTMEFVGGKWKTVILWYLSDRTLRFGQLKKLMPDITEKMLSIQLKNLEEHGLVKREVFAEVPLRVEYSMTELGHTLRPLLDEIAKWGRNYGEKAGSIVEKQTSSTNNG